MKNLSLTIWRKHYEDYLQDICKKVDEELFFSIFRKENSIRISFWDWHFLEQIVERQIDYCLHDDK